MKICYDLVFFLLNLLLLLFYCGGKYFFNPRDAVDGNRDGDDGATGDVNAPLRFELIGSDFCELPPLMKSTSIFVNFMT